MDKIIVILLVIVTIFLFILAFSYFQIDSEDFATFPARDIELTFLAQGIVHIILGIVLIAALIIMIRKE